MNGVGDEKLQLYGTRFTECIANFVKEHPELLAASQAQRAKEIADEEENSDGVKWRTKR